MSARAATMSTHDGCVPISNALDACPELEEVPGQPKYAPIPRKASKTSGKHWCIGKVQPRLNTVAWFFKHLYSMFSICFVKLYDL